MRRLPALVLALLVAGSVTAQTIRPKDIILANGQCLIGDSAGRGEEASCATGSPGGSDTHVQFNDGGAFGGEAAFAYTKADDALSVAGQVLIGTSPGTLHELEVDGHVRIEQTAVEDDDHALEIDISVAGFAGVKAVDIDYDTGVFTAGDQEGVIVIQIDESAATGGDLAGLAVLATEFGALDNVYALVVGATIEPLIQLSGAFGDADTVDDNGVDETTALSSGGAGNVSVFENDNEFLIVGDAAKYEQIAFDVATGSSGAGIAPTFEFSTGVGTWASFTPVDGTNAFRDTGVIQWLDTDIPSWATGAGTEFLIRTTRTRNSLTTTPILDLVQIVAAVLYGWDENGDLTVNNVAATTVTGANVTSGASPGHTHVEVDVTNLSHTTDTGPSPDCSGTLTYQDGEGGCDTYTLGGNTTELATITGAKTSGDCVEFDASGNVIASGAACGGDPQGISYQADPTCSSGCLISNALWTTISGPFVVSGKLATTTDICFEWIWNSAADGMEARFRLFDQTGSVAIGTFTDTSPPTADELVCYSASITEPSVKSIVLVQVFQQNGMAAQRTVTMDARITWEGTK